jgi:hypothetical protein
MRGAGFGYAAYGFVEIGCGRESGITQHRNLKARDRRSGVLAEIVGEQSTTRAAGVRSTLLTIGSFFGCDRAGKVHRDHDDDEQSA